MKIVSYKSFLNAIALYSRKYFFCRVCLLMMICASFFSCSRERGTCLFGNYKAETLLIKNSAITQLESQDYNIKIETHLSDSLSSAFVCDKMKYDGGYYFLLENGKHQTIWVFDSAGNYISKLGEKGRAKNEYQTDITDWFFIPDKGEVFVFEKDSRKIHVFSIDGRYIETRALESYPNAIGALEDGKIFCSYYHKEAKDGIQLGLLNKDETVIRNFINLKSNMQIVPTDHSFYVNQNRLFHVPSFADSAIVFHKDSVQKVVRFDFQDKFIPGDLKKEVYNGESENFHRFNGISYIETYYETSRFHYIKYVLAGVYVNHLVDKRKGKQYHFVSNLTKGLLPGSALCVRDNKLLFLVTKQNVDDIRQFITPEEYRHALSESDEIIRKIFRNEETLPLILSIEIK